MDDEECTIESMVSIALVVFVFTNKQVCIATGVAQCSTAVRDFRPRGARFII
jgi:hypothetical protein